MESCLRIQGRREFHRAKLGSCSSACFDFSYKFVCGNVRCCEILGLSGTRRACITRRRPSRAGHLDSTPFKRLTLLCRNHSRRPHSRSSGRSHSALFIPSRIFRSRPSLESIGECVGLRLVRDETSQRVSYLYAPVQGRFLQSQSLPLRCRRVRSLERE